MAREFVHSRPTSERQPACGGGAGAAAAARPIGARSVHPRGGGPREETAVSWHRLQQVSGGDSEFESELIALYLDEQRSAIEGLDEHLEAGAWSGVARAAHFIKGAASSIGAQRLAVHAARLETAARDRRVRSVAAVLVELKREAARVSEALGRRLRTGTPI